MAKSSHTDITARSISIAAILISLATFFFNYLYVSRDVKASVVQVQCAFDRLSASLVVVNNGTKQALIIDAMAQLMVDIHGERWTFSVVNTSSDVPAVVEPGKAILVRITGQIALDQALHISTDLDAIKDTTIVLSQIIIRSTDSRGIQFLATSPIDTTRIMHGLLRTDIDPKQFNVFDHEAKITTGLGQFPK
jgi:hypothetical protein